MRIGLLRICVDESLAPTQNWVKNTLVGNVEHKDYEPACSVDSRKTSMLILVSTTELLVKLGTATSVLALWCYPNIVLVINCHPLVLLDCLVRQFAPS
jgi:hypothetical protein